MSYIKDAKKLSTEIYELKLKHIILEREITRDEIKLEFLKNNFNKKFILKNMENFERELSEKKKELIKVESYLRNKMNSYGIY